MARAAALTLVGLAGHAGAVTAPLRGAHPWPAAGGLAQVHDAQRAYTHGGITEAEALPWWVWGIIAVVVVGLVATGVYFGLRGAAAEGEEKVADAEGGASAAAPPQAKTTMNQEKKKVDLEHFFQLLAKRTVHQVGPKLTKANNVRSVLYKHIGGFKQKALGFLGAELMGTVAQLLKEADAEEVMLLLNPAEALTSNIPPVSIMIAGMMSPVVLTVSLVVHLSQVFLVLCPVLIMCIFSISVDHASLMDCAVPGLWIWVYSQAVLALVLMVAHVLMVLQIQAGKTKMEEKVKEMQGRFNEALADGELSVAEMRELFVIITILLENALVIEDGLRQSVWRKVIGFATIAWILMTGWTFVIVLGWTFMPGQISFAETAPGVAGVAYCGAWASVLSARLSCVLSLFFLLFNLISVAQFVSDSLISSDMWSAQWLSWAKKYDDSSVGVPVMQTIVRAFFLRGTADTLRSQLNVSLHRTVELQHQRDELAGQIAALKTRITHHKDEAKALKISAGMPVDDEVNHAASGSAPMDGVNTEVLEKLQAETMRQAKLLEQDAVKHATELEAKTKEELEELYKKILEAVAQIREMSAEAYAQGEVAAREAAAAGSAAASDLAAQAQQHAGEAQALASQAAGQLREGISQQP